MSYNSQLQKSCTHIINEIYDTPDYDVVKNILHDWKKTNKSFLKALDAYASISGIILNNHRDMVDIYNRCLVKQAQIPDKEITIDNVKNMAKSNPNSPQILDAFYKRLTLDRQQ